MFRTVLIIIAVSAVLAAAYPNRSGRIVGGSNAMPGEMPFMASLRFWGSNFHFAGASLISNRWLVTVATPLVGRGANSIDIVLGTTMLNAGVVNRMSDAIRIHDQYNSVTRANDIACVRSLSIITFTQFINFIPMSASFIGTGVTARIAGWGATHPDKGPDSNFLQIAHVFTGACGNNAFFTFTPQHLCAGAQGTAANPPNIEDPVEPPTDSPVTFAPIGICTTDVGGPLISSNNELIGIAAWNDPTGCGRSLDGYLRISSYRVWISSWI